MNQEDFIALRDKALEKFGDENFCNVLITGFKNVERFKYEEIELFIERAPSGAQAVLDAIQTRQKAKGELEEFTLFDYVDEIISEKELVQTKPLTDISHLYIRNSA